MMTMQSWTLIIYSRCCCHTCRPVSKGRRQHVMVAEVVDTSVIGSMLLVLCMDTLKLDGRWVAIRSRTGCFDQGWAHILT